MSAVFGDFLGAASEHMAAAVAVGDDESPGHPGVTRDLHRLVAVMSRYCDDVVPCDEVEAARRNDLHAWERTAIDVRSALGFAEGCLGRTVDERGDDGDEGVAVPLEPRHLAAAATELAVGRDLLHTHLATGPDGLTRERSEWAPVVTSLPVTRALVNELARWSRQLAPFTAWLATAAPRSVGRSPDRLVPAPVRDELANASQWLQVAGAAVRAALDADPVQAADTELLYAIPPAVAPQRQRPGSAAEPVADLYHGIAISASRLRAAARGSSERAALSPNVTSGGWQWMAQAAAVTSHLGELALRSLAVRAAQLADWPVPAARLDEAADSMVGMRAAWHQVDQLWELLFTESRLLPTPAMTDASDLVLRMGRLVWDDPQWMPARSHGAARRTAEALAPEAATLIEVASAAHRAVDAFTRVAVNDMEGVAAAIQVARFYTPTRSLSADYDVPRPFAPAPMIRCQSLHDAYRVAVDASIRAARVLDGLAAAIGAPSKILGLARAAASVQSHRRGSPEPTGDEGLGDSSPAGMTFGDSRASTGRAGPVEQAIRDRHIYDPAILLRAAAIDHAARQLIIQADSAILAPAQPDRTARTVEAAGGAARLAAQSFPNDPIMKRPTDIGPALPDSPRQVTSLRDRLARLWRPAGVRDSFGLRRW